MQIHGQQEGISNFKRPTVPALRGIIYHLSTPPHLYLLMEFKRLSLSPLNHKEFRLYIFVRFFYIMALRMVTTVVGWQLFQLTQSSFSIGIAGLSEFVPVFLL